ncbi:MAG: hypothetical protein AAF986_05375 [Pseudomonadota bacterium]
MQAYVRVAGTIRPQQEKPAAPHGVQPVIFEINIRLAQQAFIPKYSGRPFHLGKPGRLIRLRSALFFIYMGNDTSHKYLPFLENAVSVVVPWG